MYFVWFVSLLTISTIYAYPSNRLTNNDLISEILNIIKDYDESDYSIIRQHLQHEEISALKNIIEKLSKSNDFDDEQMMGDSPGIPSDDEEGPSQSTSESGTIVLTRSASVDDIDPTILRNFNLTKESINRIRERTRNLQAGGDGSVGANLEELATNSEQSGGRNPSRETITVNGREFKRLMHIDNIRRNVQELIQRERTERVAHSSGESLNDPDRFAMGLHQNYGENALTSGQQEEQNFLTDDGQDFAEKSTAFNADCDPPERNDPDLWTEGPVANYLFNVSSYLSIHPSLHVESATLRVFKIANASIPIENNCENGEPNLLRISAFWYTKALRKHRAIKKRISDSVMVSAREEKWVNLDLRAAVLYWSRKTNYGIGIAVEDQEGNPISTLSVIHPPSCDKASSPPLPWLAQGSPRGFKYNIEKLPRNPRLDLYIRTPIEYISDPSFSRLYNTEGIQQTNTVTIVPKIRHRRHYNRLYNKHHIV